MNVVIVNYLPKDGHEWDHVPVGKAWKIWKSPWWGLDCHANWVINWLIFILCLVWQNFNDAFHRWEKWNPMMHIDHGSRPKAVGFGWKSPSNNWQDPRKSWRDTQDTKKFLRLGDEQKDENQQEKLMEVEGLGPKSSSK